MGQSRGAREGRREGSKGGRGAREGGREGRESERDRYTILTDRLNVTASALAAQFQFHTDTKHED